MGTRAFLLLFAGASCCCGCLARQVARDGINLRQAILEMYTDQVMDNLVRARSNMPFVQLKYTQIQANDADDLSAIGAIDQTITAMRTLATAAATRTLTNDYKASATGDRKRVMNFTADPITDQNDIYQKYLDFANNPSLFVVSDCAPACPVHIMRKCGRKYYWVPAEAGPAFLDLCMKTTFMRGKDDGQIAPAAYAVKIADVKKAEKLAKEDIINASLVFDKPVPNGEGLLVVDLADGRAARIGLLRVYQDTEGKAVDLGRPTTRLEAQWFPVKDKLQPDDLKGRPARFYSHDFPPEVQGAPPILQQINTNLNTIRSQVQLQNVGR
jgi:hypothetical protein